MLSDHISKCSLIAPIDINEDGKHDVLCQVQDDSGKMDIKFILNNVWLDSFFLKAIMINEHMGDISGAHSEHSQHYGDIVIGATFRFVTTNLEDRKQIVSGSQMIQSTYNSLLPPYVHLGVGRSNNYIESFNSAFSYIRQGNFTISVKTPIIPNSQMVVFSNPGVAETWKVELFTNPDQNVYLIMVSCAIFLFLVGINIIVLHVQEKTKDKEKT